MVENDTKPPKIVVAIDFGTTFSGFAYALTSDPTTIRKHYAWPDLGAAGGNPYCKAPTCLLYHKDEASGSYSLDSWGYSAIVNYATKVRIAQGQRSYQADDQSYVFIDKFKLLLASEGQHSLEIPLPKGLAIKAVISDYLRELGKLILKVLREKLGNYITKQDIQWLVTVPAIWDERAKQQMKQCAEFAGLVHGPGCIDQDASPHPVMIVLEPEAAAIYCQQKGGYHLNDGDTFLVVDVGGGTTDLVLHEKVRSTRLLEAREVSPSSGGICGGVLVDDLFLKFLSRKICCFENYKIKQPRSVLRILGEWEKLKYGFDGNMEFAYNLELPAKLAREWEEEDKLVREWEEEDRRISPDECTYDMIRLSVTDLLGIFDPVVDNILGFIKTKMNECSTLASMMVVGGFSGSPYLAKRIKEAFSSRTDITIPMEAGSAICCGAVTYGIHGATLIKSRFAKQTYGFSVNKLFEEGDPEDLKYWNDVKRVYYCKRRFQTCVNAGEEVPLHHCITFGRIPVERKQTSMKLSLFSSSSSREPKYETDTGVRELGTFVVDHPSVAELGQIPELSISIYFGKEMIEVTATEKNFGKGRTFAMPSVVFDA